MDEIHIDRLSLKLSGITEHEGRDLARRVAERLAAIELPEAAREPGEALRVGVSAAADEGLDGLSERIVAEVLRQLVRSS